MNFGVFPQKHSFDRSPGPSNLSDIKSAEQMMGVQYSAPRFGNMHFMNADSAGATTAKQMHPRGAMMALKILSGLKMWFLTTGPVAKEQDFREGIENSHKQLNVAFVTRPGDIM